MPYCVSADGDVAARPTRPGLGALGCHSAAHQQLPAALAALMMRLQGLDEREAITVIVDDSHSVWSQHRHNLVGRVGGSRVG